MGEFMLYLAKAAICLAVFSLFFRLLLMKETFFRFTRIMLLAGLVICSLIPFVKIGISHPTMFQRPIEQLERIFVPFGTSGENALLKSDRTKETHEETVLAAMPGKSVRLRPDEVTNSQYESAFVTDPKEMPMVGWEKTIPLVTLLFALYLLGVLGMCVRLAVSLWRLQHLIRNNRITIQDGYRLIVSRESITPFSFFNYIVLSEADYHSNAKEIILHEQMHIKYRHHLDILFSELFLMVHWFNPAAWSLYNDLREIHEYEADNAVIEQGINAHDYQLLLVKKAVGEKRFTSVVNSFNQSKIKNRIAMMLRKESKTWARFKILFIVPLTAVMLLAFAQPESAEGGMDGDQSMEEVVSIVKQVQNNSFFYWDEIQQYCAEKGIRPSDLKTGYETNRNRVVDIKINSNNQITYRNHVSAETIKTQEEGNSPVSVQVLKKYMVEGMKIKDPTPLCYSFQYETSTSTCFLFNFLNSTLPAAYEAALNEVSERDGISVDRLRKENPLLLLHQIQQNFEWVANHTLPRDALKNGGSVIRGVMTDEKGKSRSYSILDSGGSGIDYMSTHSGKNPDKSGDDSIRQEAVTPASALDHTDLAFVSMNADVTITDIEHIQTTLDNLKVEKTIYVLNMQ